MHKHRFRPRYTPRMSATGPEQCPCCDYFCLRTRGSYDVCPVCYWEDDGVGLGQLDEPSAVNHITLREGRRNFLRYGAADLAALPLVASAAERAGLRREVRS